MVVDDFVVLVPVDGVVVESVGTGTVVVVFVDVLVELDGPGVTTGVTTGVLSWMTVVLLVAGAVSSAGGLLTSHPAETMRMAPVTIAAAIPFFIKFSCW